MHNYDDPLPSPEQPTSLLDKAFSYLRTKKETIAVLMVVAYYCTYIGTEITQVLEQQEIEEQYEAVLAHYTEREYRVAYSEQLYELIVDLVLNSSSAEQLHKAGFATGMVIHRYNRKISDVDTHYIDIDYHDIHLSLTYFYGPNGYRYFLVQGTNDEIATIHQVLCDLDIY